LIVLKIIILDFGFAEIPEKGIKNDLLTQLASSTNDPVGAMSRKLCFGSSNTDLLKVYGCIIRALLMRDKLDGKTVNLLKFLISARYITKFPPRKLLEDPIFSKILKKS
jgi:hypothetical protein